MSVRILLLCLATLPAMAQPKKKPTAPASQPLERPKLVVGIVVDQMRYDFLYRYWDKYSESGFKRLLRQGYSFDQAHYPYAPTVTGPGHASIYTGSTPAFHGIAGNTWYLRGADKIMYCVDDSTAKGVGAEGASGRMSPRNLWSTTVGDELKKATNMRAKVIGVALKDRGGILPAGRAADAAYWFDSKSGNWITSDYYVNTLPAWASAFNAGKKADAYAKSTWATLLPASAYADYCTADSNAYEGTLAPGAPPTLPIDLGKHFKGDYELVRTTPFGNQITTDFALAALAGEQLGTHAVPDMLCLSYSSTDYVGHRFGPNSVECMDVYLRLDQEIARLLDALDKAPGLKNTLIFLTADHGVTEVPALAQARHLPAGRFDMKEARKHITERLTALYGPGDYCQAHLDEQIYLNRPLIEGKKLDFDVVARQAAQAALSLPYVNQAFAAADLPALGAAHPFGRRFLLGYCPSRSGDVYLMVKPGYIDSPGEKGTTHSSPYEYDTHVPMIFFGWGIPQGSTSTWSEVTDIAPTVSQLLHIMAPSAAIGRPLQFK